MAEQSESKVISLKLLIDTKANKVLFAEAGKEFVDFLFHIMSLPIGTVINLLNVNSMVGSLGALYKSIDSLSSDYFQPNLSKETVLKPRAPVNVPLLSLNDAAPTDKKVLYRCNSSHSGSQNNAASASTEVGSGGYVKALVTYMVMDNLEVKPMSTITGITLMNKFRVKDVSALEEKEVQVGLNEVILMSDPGKDEQSYERNSSHNSAVPDGRKGG
ncbi:uncharacterized protein [Spinacia oleracea]|uniref:DUF674 domain-containing protein n=1 Tax=Spinacia oleracea TaxID=3562 RepID=A0ABM3R480_SPIOL|nr:uncharacterized protein LOC110805657 [Spinacia oleracea]